jgi:DNA topoisomerase-6 subunit B
MSSQEQGVAQDLADEQRQTSIAEFFEKNKQMLGFGSETRALVTAVKEGVDNSLDAAEEARVFPDVRVDIVEGEQYYTVTIEDNGPGIPKDSIADVFGKLLYGSRFHRRMQQRGQQGIGISAAVLYSQLTSGNPARITSKTIDSDKAHYVEMGIDTEKNCPEIHTDEEVDWDKEHGIKIELDMAGNMRARNRLHRYIENTSVVNPHATIELHEPEYNLIYDERPVDELPEEVEEIKPHPHGVELGTLIDMLDSTDCRKLKSFFQTEFTRVGAKTAEGIIGHFRDIHYGRAVSWNVNTDDVGKSEYVESITNVVNGKGKEATNIFATYVYDYISNLESASKVDVKDGVREASREAQEETGKQFASTVQEKTIESVWGVLIENIEHTTLERVDGATIDRKSDEMIELLSDELSIRFREINTDSTVTKDDLEQMIEDSTDAASKRYDGSFSFGKTAQEKVYDVFWDSSSRQDIEVPSIRDIKNDRDTARNLLLGMRKANAMSPPKKCISPISESHILEGLKSKYDADFYTSSTRSAKVADGDPFVVESGIAYGGEIESEGQIRLSRFANRVPLVYQQGACTITKEIKDITWNTYYKSGDSISQSSGNLPQGPMVLLVHVASTNVNFTSESKDAIAGVPEIQKEVEMAVRESARELKSHLSDQRTKRKRQEKRDVIGSLLSDMTDKIENITEGNIDSKQQSQAKILNNVLIRRSSERCFEVINYAGRKRDISGTLKTEDGVEEFELSVSKGEDSIIESESEIESIDIEEPDSSKYTLGS